MDELKRMLDDLYSIKQEIVDAKLRQEHITRALMEKLLRDNMLEFLSINYGRLNRALNPHHHVSK